MKFNVLNHTKKLLIALSGILVVALVILCIFGLNLGTDIKGYIGVRVNLGHYGIVEEEFDNHTKSLVELLEANGAKVVATNTENTGFSASLIIKVERNSKDRQECIEYGETLKTLIDNNYNDSLLVVESYLEEGVMTNPNVVRVIYTALIAIICAMIYLMFRVKLLNTVCIMTSTLTTAIILVALMTLTRVKINSNAFGVVLCAIVLSMALSSIKLADVKNSKRDLTKKEVGEIKLTSPIMVMSAILVIASLLLVIFGTSIVKAYALLVILSVISVLVSDQLVLMPLCYYLNNYTIKKVKVEKVESIEEDNDENDDNEKVEEDDDEEDDD